MANRGNSPGPGSSSSSSLELPAVQGLSKNSGHPEQWTLPHEWNIEKREMFGVCVCDEREEYLLYYSLIYYFNFNTYVMTYKKIIDTTI